VKLVCIFASPMPYNTPILNALAQQVDLHVVYLSGEDRITGFADAWGEEPRFDHSFFWSRSLNSTRVDLQTQLSVGISRRLRRVRPDGILVRSWKPAVLEPLAWSRVSGTGATMWSESTRFSGVLRGATSTLLRRALLRSVDSFVSNGTQATAYLRELGVPEAKIVTSRLPARLNAGVSTDRAVPADAGVRFLWVGRLIPRKRPLELIEVFASAHAEMPDATLTLVGGGALEPDVREAVRRVQGVTFAGFAEGSDLARLYAASDVLVLPALREVWGLVVNEALAHGLYVIASDEVGSAYDLLDKRSGRIVPARDRRALRSALVQAAHELDRSDGARRARARAVEGCTPELFARAIVEASELAVSASRRRRRSVRASR
jgi:glycosyltransferase involved in cell wall biosynthesis